MSDVRITYGDAVYCSVGDVEGMFRNEAGFGTDTNPSDQTVLDWIRDASDEIDQHTRHAWRENTVTEEFHNYSTRYRWDAGRPVTLTKMELRTPLDSNKGDKLEVWDGSDWSDWVTDSAKTEDRDGDYWFDSSHGRLWIYDRFVWRSRPQLRVTYRYGHDSGSSTSKILEDNTSYTVSDPPRDIRKACRLLVAGEVVSTDQYSQFVPGGEGGMSPQAAVDRWEAKVYGDGQRKGLLEKHKIDPAWVEPY